MNAQIPSTLVFGRMPLVDPKTGMLTREGLRYLNNLDLKTNKTLTINAEITPGTPVAGRAEGIGTTVQQLTPTGQLASTDQIAADGAGSPLEGGRRGFQALDVNNRIASSIHLQAVDAGNVPTSTTGMSNDGISTAVAVPAQGFRFGFGTVSYNLTSFDPGSFGTWFAYADDPTFAGGTVAVQFTTDQTVAKTGALGRIYFGAITTVGGAAKTGGGSTGGTTNGGGGGNRGQNL